jgi:hypothetical protein
LAIDKRKSMVNQIVAAVNFGDQPGQKIYLIRGIIVEKNNV